MMASMQDGRASPIMEHEHEGEDYYGSDEVSPSGCGCFCFNWWRQGHGARGYRPYQKGERGTGGGESWLANKLKGVKEASEVVAGPKWKTFIRKVGGYLKEKKNRNRFGFGYDAESYALNFDKGMEGEEDAGLLMSYSSRFVGPPPSQ
ncbi:hypothetical protein MLD38_014446 [Melastoma candidum]|uniref:Uncharacterized protein n=1 Tax=Melastoma candidum TaxID=119954 RepID=A0ACB9RL95_9MYRT|nr:hypothetical protein MLD38_014446 [Melastoma candidum]